MYKHKMKGNRQKYKSWWAQNKVPVARKTAIKDPSGTNQKKKTKRSIMGDPSASPILVFQVVNQRLL